MRPVSCSICSNSTHGICSPDRGSYFSLRLMASTANGYGVVSHEQMLGYCTYRNRSDDGRFAFNINAISSNAIVSKFYPVFRFTNANSLFMSEFLNSSSRVKKKLSVLAVGTSQVVLSFEALKAATFDLPCKDEQDKIASFLSCLNRRIEYQRTFKEHALLGIGLMLSSSEITRIAGAFGLDTSTRANIMSAVYTAQTAVHTGKAIVQAVSK